MRPIQTSGDGIFLAANWRFQNGSGGYLGIQRNGYLQGITGSLAIHSVWDIGDGTQETLAKIVTTPNGTNAGYFTHEGEGVQSARNYSFSDNTTYELSLVRQFTTSNGHQWRAEVTDTRTGVRTHISTITTPLARGKIASLTTFLERFGASQNNCSIGPQSSAAFFDATGYQGNNAVGVRVEDRQYSDCPNYIKTEQYNSNGARIQFF